MPKETIKLSVRVSPNTPNTLSNLARVLGFEYGNSGATGELMDAIAQGKFLLIPCENLEKVGASIDYFRYSSNVRENTPDNEP